MYFCYQWWWNWNATLVYTITPKNLTVTGATDAKL
jgi:hypothetical protein